MSEHQSFAVECRSLTPNEAEYIYRGAICEDGAMSLSQRLLNSFDYYKYDRVSIQLESPGGKASSLDLLMRVIGKWERLGKSIAIRTEFQCASAAALLLSLSQWGLRRVDRGAMLIYHFVRIGSSITNLTATQAGGVAQTLENMDQHMLSRLLSKLKNNAGGTQELLTTFNQRMAHLDKHWNWVSEQMPTSIFSTEVSTRRPDWHKALRSICKDGIKPDRAMALYEKHLFQRFKQDTPMDLREAYVLCLIDEIDDVIGPKDVMTGLYDDAYVDTPSPSTVANQLPPAPDESLSFRP